jgi:hypothetical protein
MAWAGGARRSHEREIDMFDSIPEGWTALLLLGAFHGVNPGMGWLFAVALGLQEGSGRAVWRALPPLIAGHALAVGVAIAVGALLGVAIGSAPVRWGLAATLVTMGILHLRRAWHPRFGGMRVGPRDLLVWSFLMATGHGAGLMALAFVPTGGDTEAHAAALPATAAPLAMPSAHAGHVASMSSGDAVTGLLASLVHTLGYLLTTVLLAAVVFYRLGLRLLQRGWLNLDVLWAGALVLTGLVILVA